MASATLEPSAVNLQADAPRLETDPPRAHGPEEADADPSSARKVSGGKVPRWLLGAAAAGVLFSSLGYRWWIYARTHAGTDNAFITANIHQISSRVAGTVVEVPVSDNQRAALGSALVKLDSREFELRVQQARNQVAQTDAQLLQAGAQLKQAHAQATQSEAKSAKAVAELQRARLDFERAKQLTEGERFATISKQEYDAAQASFEVAQASTQVAQADLQSSQALVQAALAAQAVVKAQRQTAEVNLADAELQLSYTVIPAPVDGVVGRKSVEVGQRVQPGQALLAVVAEQKWIVANFKETQLARMIPGQCVAIRVDAIPGRVFRGSVESFSPASGAQFALLPSDNATGNFTKIVQRVPVKILFDPAGLRGFESRILPGLSATVDVQLGPPKS